jgi:hypothetical protein
VHTLKSTARRAGWLYLSIVLLAPFALIYVPNHVIVPGDAVATAAKIHASEGLFRAGIAFGLMSDVVWILVSLALYHLFVHVDRRLALTMATLSLISVPISFLDRLNQIGALVLLSGADFLTVFTEPQRQALAMLFLKLYGQGILIVEIYWGLWLVPFGILIWKSGWIPKIFGILVLLAGAGYVVASVGTLLFPASRDALDTLTSVLGFGELPIVLWLAIVGAWGPRANEPMP